jgi:hypothetical protein
VLKDFRRVIEKRGFPLRKQIGLNLLFAAQLGGRLAPAQHRQDRLRFELRTIGAMFLGHAGTPFLSRIVVLLHCPRFGGHYSRQWTLIPGQGMPYLILQPKTVDEFDERGSAKPEIFSRKVNFISRTRTFKFKTEGI